MEVDINFVQQNVWRRAQSGVDWRAELVQSWEHFFVLLGTGLTSLL